MEGKVNSPQWGGENRKFYWGGGEVLPGKGNLRKGYFDASNLFES